MMMKHRPEALWRRFRGKRFRVIFFTFFSMIALCTMLVGGVAISFLHQSLEQEQDSYASMTAKVSMGTFSVFDRSIDVLEALREDETIPALAAASVYPDGTDEAETFYNTWRYQYMRGGFGAMHTVFLYFEQSGRTLRCHGEHNSLYDAYASGEIFDMLDLDEETWQALTKTNQEFEAQLIRDENMDFARLFVSSEVIPGVRLICGFGEEYLLETIAQYYLPEGSQVVLMTKNGMMISQEGSDAEPGALASLCYDDLAALAQGETLTVGDTTYFAYVAPMFLGEAIQLILIPDTRAAFLSAQLRLLMLGVPLLALIGGAAAALLLASWMYRPIQRLLRSLPIDPAQGDERYEYDLFQSVLDMLVKNAASSSEQLAAQRRLLLHNLLLRCMQGDLPMTGAVEDALFHYGLHLPGDTLTVLLFRFEAQLSEDDAFASREDYLRSSSLIERHCAETLEKRGVRHELFWHAGMLVGVLSSESAETSLEDVCREMAVEVQQSLDTRVWICASLPCSGLPSLPDAYAQALDTVRRTEQMDAADIVTLYDPRQIEAEEREILSIDAQQETPIGADKREKIDDITDYIASELSNNALSASMVADHFSISVSWMGVLFNQRYQMGFLEYLHRQRLALAREKIMTTAEPIKQIALEVGYSNYLTMVRAFKRYEGIVPTQLRHSTSDDAP